MNRVSRKFFKQTNHLFFKKYLSKDWVYDVWPLSATSAISFSLQKQRWFWGTILHYFLQCFEIVNFWHEKISQIDDFDLKTCFWDIKIIFRQNMCPNNSTFFSGHNRPHIPYFRDSLLRIVIFSPLNSDFQWPKYDRK